MRFTRFENFERIPRLTTAQFYLRALGNYVPPLTWVQGFSPDMIQYCSMHTVNLGIDQWTNGCTLMALLDRSFFGPTSIPLPERLQVVTLRFRSWCSVHSIEQSQPFITVGMLHLQYGCPELSLKAYHSRVFVQFMASCCEAALSNGSPDKELILLLAVTHNLAQWHLKLEAFPRYLTTEMAQELIKLGDAALRAYRGLARLHSRRGSPYWALKPRLHVFQEINYGAARRLYNPRYSHCFRDEDQMGAVKHIVRRVHKNMLETRTLCRLQLRYANAARKRSSIESHPQS